jgi:hypothetical protein
MARIVPLTTKDAGDKSKELRGMLFIVQQRVLAECEFLVDVGVGDIVGCAIIGFNCDVIGGGIFLVAN